MSDIMQRSGKQKYITILAWTAGLLWILLILSLSGDPADVSREKSRLVLEKVEEVIKHIEQRFDVELVDKSKLHFYIRKNAHVFIYFVLGALMFIAWKTSGARGRTAYYMAWLTAFVFSVMDECYQSFVPGRSGEVRDVLLDNAGIAGALLLIAFIRYIRVKDR